MSKELSILDAKLEAQKIAFGPIYFQAVIAMKQLGIFELLSKKKDGILPEKISDTLNIGPYGVEVLLEAAESAGVVEVLENGAVKLTKIGIVLNSDELTRINLNFINDVCYNAAKYTTESIVGGRPEGLKVFGNWNTVYEGLSQLPEKTKQSWFEFDHFYSDEAFPPALEIVFSDHPKHIFDIGGNTGKWSIACCQYNNVVKVTILDLEGQLNEAKKNVAEQPFADRISFFPIDFLDKQQRIPTGADAIWMSQFLDCFSKTEIINILENVYQVLDYGASVYILEPFTDTQAYPAASYSLTATSLYFTTVANGNSKFYKEKVMIELVERVGFTLEKSYPLIGNSFHTILKFKKK